MDAVRAVGAASGDALTEVALSAIIAKAAALGRRESKANRGAIYEQAKAAVGEFNPTADQYEQAMRLLTEALDL